MALTERSRPVVMALTRMVNLWKAYDRRGHELAGEHYTAGEFQCLKVVAEFPGRNTTELADQLGVTKSAVSQAVSKLVDKGVLERYRGTESDRDTFTRLTEKGSRAYQAHMKSVEAQVQRIESILADAPPEQIDFMLRFVTAAAEFFEEQLAGGAQ